jgi:hypothetical protein
MRVGTGEFTYEWIEDFAEIPDPEAAASGWSHNGITVTPKNTLITSHPALPLAVELSLEGALLNTWEPGVTEAHGIVLHDDGKDGHLWFSDIGSKPHPDTDYQEWVLGESGPHNVKTTPEGDVVMELFTPPIAAYEEGGYSPTEAAVYSAADGGNDDVWIADGYGKWKVHRYDKEGNYLSSIDGTEGDSGAFDEPHAVWVDVRKGDAELYITDRTNRRVQVYDLEGAGKRTFAHDAMVLPGAFATLGDYLVVADLVGRLDILDIDDRLVMSLGTNPSEMERPGWPNDLDANGANVRTATLQEGIFNSPHGITTDAAGNIYISEWLIGGRYIKLALV